MTEPIDMLIAKAERNPTFMAFALRNHADAAVAETLDIPLDRVPHLRLCLAPRGGADYQADLAELAAYVGTTAERLDALLRAPQE